MSFYLNSFQQISIWDDTNCLTERECHLLNNSWAVPFAEIIFPSIDEEPYRVLYSDKDSRPNTPVNIIIGALLLKELNGLTDEGIFNSLLFDIRYRIALHTTSFIEQPLSDRTLSRFRERCLKYYNETGVDLLHNTIAALSESIAEIIKADRTLLRMDSVMVESNIKKLSRLELIYKCTSNAVKKNFNRENIPHELNHFLSGGDYNVTFYHENANDENILKDAEIAASYLKDSKTEETDIFFRMLSEQTCEVDGKLSLSDTANSQILQSPYDTDATFRKKLKSSHHGYVANLIESCGNNSSVILDYQYEQNIYSDSRFLKDTVKNLGIQASTCTLVTDGGYSGNNNTELARENNIILITTNLSGRKPNDYLDYRTTDEFKRFSNFRNGVEALPSLLRRKYRIDRMPVRGKYLTQFFFGCKIGAINISKLCLFLKQSSSCVEKRK